MKYFVGANEIKNGEKSFLAFVVREHDGKILYSSSRSVMTKQEAQEIYEKAVANYVLRKSNNVKTMSLSKKWLKTKYRNINFFIGKEKNENH